MHHVYFYEFIVISLYIKSETPPTHKPHKKSADNTGTKWLPQRTQTLTGYGFDYTFKK